MNFITLDDTLTGLANCIAAHQEHTFIISEEPIVRYPLIGSKGFYTLYQTSNGLVKGITSCEEDSYRYSEAARILDQTLKNFPESHTMWCGRQVDKELLQNNDVSTYGMAVLKHTKDWHHWETKLFVGNKFSVLNCKPVLDPSIEPMSFNLTKGQYPRQPSFCPYELGFNRAELIAFLDRNAIKHDLTLQDEPELPIINITGDNGDKKRLLKKRKSQLHAFIWSVHQALNNIKKPSAQEVWKEMQQNWEAYDTEKIIQEIDGAHIFWCSCYGSEGELKRTSFSKTLSKIRKNPPLLEQVTK